MYRLPPVPARTYHCERVARTQAHVTVRHSSTHLYSLTYEYSRTEFSATDDEHLCQYIAEILPDKGQGGRTGHFIYSDLMRRVGTFSSEFSHFSLPFRQMNLVNTPGRAVTLKMDGASAIAGTRNAWTRGSRGLLRKTPLHSTGKVNICPGDMGGLSKIMS
jgi:hypothetical protein